MNKLVCPSCLHANDVNSERIIFCRNCHKKLSHNYVDWKKTTSNPDFSHYTDEFQQHNRIAFSEHVPISEQKDVKVSNRRGKSVFQFVAVVCVLFVTFSVAWIIQQHDLKSGNDYQESKNYLVEVQWKKYTIADSISVTIPFPLKKSESIISEYLSWYTQSIKSNRAESCQSFSVTIEEYELQPHLPINHQEFIPLQDKYVTIARAEIYHLEEKTLMAMKGYSVQLDRNTFIKDNENYFSDNYTLTKGNKGVKIIISYLKNDELLNKYADIVNESIFRNA